MIFEWSILYLFTKNTKLDVYVELVLIKPPVDKGVWSALQTDTHYKPMASRTQTHVHTCTHTHSHTNRNTHASTHALTHTNTQANTHFPLHTAYPHAHNTHTAHTHSHVNPPYTHKGAKMHSSPSHTPTQVSVQVVCVRPYMGSTPDFSPSDPSLPAFSAPSLSTNE